MSTTIGRVEYIAGINGDRMPAEARKVGKAAGREAGKSFNESFDAEFTNLGKSMAAKMQKEGRGWGIDLGQSMRDSLQSSLQNLSDDVADALNSDEGIRRWNENFGSASEGVDGLEQSLNRLRDGGMVTWNDFQAAGKQIRSFRSAIDDANLGIEEQNDLLLDSAISDYREQVRLSAEDTGRWRAEMADLSNSIAESNTKLDEQESSQRRLGEEWSKSIDRFAGLSAITKKLGGDIDDTDDKSKRFHKTWSEMPHGFRQAAFYTGLFAALGTSISVLGSVAGSSLAVLASSATSMGIGLGVAIAAFRGLNDELSTLPVAIQPAAEAFQGLGNAFDILQDKIQLAAMGNAGPAFDSLRATVEALTPAFEAVGGAIGRVIDSFAAGLAPGTAGFQTLSTIISNAAPVVEGLSAAMSAFGGALGTIFVAAQPSVMAFVNGLTDIGKRFSEFLASTEGQTALADFFGTLATIMPPLLELVAAAGQLLADLVTPQTVSMTVGLLQALTGFMPALTGILSVIGALNIFGLIAELLNTLGAALMPLIPALTQFAGVISGVLSGIITALMPVLGKLLEAFMPLLPIIANLIAVVVAALIPAITSILEAIIPVIDIIIAGLEPVIEALAPVIGMLAGVIAKILVTAINLLAPILEPLIDIFIMVWEVVEPLIPIIMQLVEMALIPLTISAEILGPIIGALIEIVGLLLKPILDLISPLFEAVGGIDGISEAMTNSMGMIRDWGNTVEDVIDGVIGWISDAIGWFQDLFSAGDKAGSSGKSGGGVGRPFASGGIARNAAYRYTGEAGPEAIVPLNRPLSSVDPSVRALAAFAQGQGGGTPVAGGGGATIMPGAIVVNGVRSPVLAAEAVLDRFAANL